ncbi:hypothetical protein BWI17_21995 [Betaproteobacteria bacterium GR16-43]|nr:hypothetical protein BWI17_21995 [Betaproteobacteria bacterium GR16-43]
MKTNKRIIPALVVSLFATLGAAQSQAAQFSNVYVFGDSLSDAGYFRPFLTSLGLPSTLVATLGRFTINPGPVWSELVSQHYGVATPGPSNAGGTIYAQGGARVSQASASTPPGAAQRPVSTQITEYLGSSGVADPNALYAVFAGGNDMLQNLGLFQAGQITQAQLQANVLQAASDDVAQIARLRNAGARYILAFALPDVGGTPSAAAGGAAVAASVTALSAGYNTTLFTGLASAGVRAIPVDVFGLFTDVKNNAASFGITNTTGIACLPFPPITTTGSSQFCTSANIVPNGQTYLFADSVHPTPIAQAILADYVEGLIDGPSQYSLMAETALHARTAHVRSLGEGVRTAFAAKQGNWNVFVSYDNSDLNFDARQGLQEQRTDNNNLSVGVSMMASENVAIGAAWGRAEAKARFGNSAGSYRLHEDAFSVFFGYRGQNLYAGGALSISNTDYNDIKRNIKLGPVTRTAEATAQGNNGSFFGNVGYDFKWGNLQIGPLVSLAAQNVDINSFSESAAAGTPTNTGLLSIGTQKRRSEVWSVGGKASYDIAGWTPWIRVTADKERRDDPRFVTATVQSLGSIGNSYDIEGYRPDSTFITTSLGVRGNITNWVGVGLTFYKVSSREGIKDDGVTAALAVRF